MDTLEAIRTRRSVRKFLDRPVEPEKLRAVLEAVRMAPSWANMQCWRFVVVEDPQVRARISELSHVEEYFAAGSYKTNPARKGLAQAPVVIVACADPGRSGTVGDKHYYMADIGIAAQTLMLAAHAQDVEELITLAREVKEASGPAAAPAPGAYAHMWGGGNSGPPGYGPGYGWNRPMGPGWMSRMGQMPHTSRMSDGRGRPYMGCGWYYSGGNASPGPDAASPRHRATPEGGMAPAPGNSSPSNGGGR